MVGKPSQLMELEKGEIVSKRLLYDLIVDSKIEGSDSWEGPEWRIGNTPQQGINWIGPEGSWKCAIIKAKSASYAQNGWIDDTHDRFRYALKASRGSVNPKELANRVLLDQPELGHPVLLFVDDPKGWHFEGFFEVQSVASTFVELGNWASQEAQSVVLEQPERGFFGEGSRRFVSHLLVERSKAAVDAAKRAHPWNCDICSMLFSDRYGLQFVEAHHKIPISRNSGRTQVSVQDFALLCPNCHRAVHLLMQLNGFDYEEAKVDLQQRMSGST